MPLRFPTFNCALPPEFKAEICPPSASPPEEAPAPRPAVPRAPRTSIGVRTGVASLNEGTSGGDLTAPSAPLTAAPQIGTLRTSQAAATQDVVGLSDDARESPPDPLGSRGLLAGAGANIEPAATATTTTTGATPNATFVDLGTGIERLMLAQLARMSLHSVGEMSETDRASAAMIKNLMGALDTTRDASHVPMWKRAINEVNSLFKAVLYGNADSPSGSDAKRFAPVMTFLSPAHLRMQLPPAREVPAVEWVEDGKSIDEANRAVLIEQLAPYLAPATESAIDQIVDSAIAIEIPIHRALASHALATRAPLLSTAQLARLAAVSAHYDPTQRPDATGKDTDAIRTDMVSALLAGFRPGEFLVQEAARSDTMSDGMRQRMDATALASLSPSEMTGFVDKLLADEDFRPDAVKQALLAQFILESALMEPLVFNRHAADIGRVVARVQERFNTDAQGVYTAPLAERLPGITISGILDSIANRPPIDQLKALEGLDTAIDRLGESELQKHQPQIRRAVDLWLARTRGMQRQASTTREGRFAGAIGKLDPSTLDTVIVTLGNDRARRVRRQDSGGIGSLLLSMHRLTDAQIGAVAAIVVPERGAPDIESLKMLPDALEKMSVSQVIRHEPQLARMIQALQNAVDEAHRAPGSLSAAKFVMDVVLPFARSVAILADRRMEMATTEIKP